MDLLQIPIPPMLQAALCVIVISDLGMLAAERLQQGIRLLTLQGAVLALLPIVGDMARPTWHLLVITLIFFLLKAVVLPHLLRRTRANLPASPPAGALHGL